MGMFDSVDVKCPACGGNVEFQSKAGDCCLFSYTLETAPDVIIADLADQEERCECGHVVKLRSCQRPKLMVE